MTDAPLGFSALLDEFDQLAELARAVRISESAVASWWRRESIPYRHFRGIAAFARKKGKARVTMDALKEAAAIVKQKKQAEQALKRARRQAKPPRKSVHKPCTIPRTATP